MKTILPRYAGIVAAVLAIALIIGVFAFFGTIDLIYMKDGYEVGREENISLFSDIKLYTEPGETEPAVMSYEYNGERFVVSEGCANLKEHLVYTVLLNTVTFKFADEADDFVLTVEQ